MSYLSRILVIFYFFLGILPITYAQVYQTKLEKLDSLGLSYWQNSSYAMALFHYEKALKIAQEYKDEKWEARIFNYLGIVCENKGELKKSLKYHFKGLEIKEKLQDKEGIARSYANIGITYYSSEKIKKSLEYYFKAIKIAKNDDLMLKVHIYYYISSSYRKLKQYKKAVEYAKKALSLAQTDKGIDIIVDIQNGLGLIYTEQGKYIEGRKYYQKAYEIANRAKYWLTLTNNLQHLAENYELSNELNTAIEYTQKSIKLAKKHELKMEERNGYEILARLYNKKGKYKIANEFYLKFNGLKDSIFDLEKNKQIEELAVQYETEKKEQKIEILEKDKKIKQNTIFLLLLGIAVVLILLILILFAYRSRQIIYKQKQKFLESEIEHKENLYHLEQEKMEEELRYQEYVHQVEQEKMNIDLKHKERELASNTLHILEKNQMLNNLQEKINEFDLKTKNKLKPLFQEIKNNLDLDKDWERFTLHFTQIHPKFFTQLQKDFPILSQKELKLLGYTALKLSNKEVASILNISPKSVEMSRYRLKKKLELGKDEDFNVWLDKYL